MEIMDAVRAGQLAEKSRREQEDRSGVPADAQFVISVLNGERTPAHDDRRRYRRHPFVAAAEIEVLGDAAPPRQAVYARDASPWGVGFVSQHPLPVGRDATLRIWVAGEMLMLRTCVLRCREVLPGWFEGAALLYSEEPRLDVRETPRE
jgi:hypothetical protein